MTEEFLRTTTGQQVLAQRFAAGADVPPERAAQLAVFLASGQGDALSGRFLSITDNVADLVQRAEEIRREDRYVLRLRK